MIKNSLAGLILNPEANAQTPPAKAKKETADQTIKAKWGERLFEVNKTRGQRIGGFIPVVRSFLRLYQKVGLSAPAAMAVLHILDSKWDKNAPWTSAPILAKRMGRSESQVKKYIAELRDVGVVATYHPKKRNYTFDFDQFFSKLADQAAVEIEELKKKREEAADAY